MKKTSQLQDFPASGRQTSNLRPPGPEPVGVLSHWGDEIGLDHMLMVLDGLRAEVVEASPPSHWQLPVGGQSRARTQEWRRWRKGLNSRRFSDHTN